MSYLHEKRVSARVYATYKNVTSVKLVNGISLRYMTGLSGTPPHLTRVNLSPARFFGHTHRSGQTNDTSVFWAGTPTDSSTPTHNSHGPGRMASTRLGVGGTRSRSHHRRLTVRLSVCLSARVYLGAAVTSRVRRVELQPYAR